MSDIFDNAFAEVQVLTRISANKKDYYLSTQYQEARQDFIDKLWEALGWDVRHDTQRTGGLMNWCLRCTG